MQYVAIYRRARAPLPQRRRTFGVFTHDTVAVSTLRTKTEKKTATRILLKMPYAPTWFDSRVNSFGVFIHHTVAFSTLTQNRKKTATGIWIKVLCAPTWFDSRLIPFGMFTHHTVAVSTLTKKHTKKEYVAIYLRARAILQHRSRPFGVFTHHTFAVSTLTHTQTQTKGIGSKFPTCWIRGTSKRIGSTPGQPEVLGFTHHTVAVSTLLQIRKTKTKRNRV